MHVAGSLATQQLPSSMVASAVRIREHIPVASAAITTRMRRRVLQVASKLHPYGPARPRTRCTSDGAVSLEPCIQRAGPGASSL